MRRAALTGKDYEVRVSGGPVPAELLEGVTDVRELQEPPSSVLFCHVEDQAQMQGLVARISMLGLDVVEIRPLPDSPGLDADAPAEP
jgi:hypothetical protein